MECGAERAQHRLLLCDPAPVPAAEVLRSRQPGAAMLLRGAHQRGACAHPGPFHRQSSAFLLQGEREAGCIDRNKEDGSAVQRPAESAKRGKEIAAAHPVDRQAGPRRKALGVRPEKPWLPATFAATPDLGTASVKRSFWAFPESILI